MYRLQKMFKSFKKLLTTPRVGNLIKLCVLNKMYYKGEIDLATKFDKLKEGEVYDCRKLYN